VSRKLPDVRLPGGLRRFRHFRGSASERHRRPSLEEFSVRRRVPRVTQGWRALRLPALVAPLVYLFQRARYARAGKIALTTVALAPLLVVAGWIEAGIDVVQQQVRRVREQHETFVANRDTTVLVLGTDDVPTKASRRLAGRSDTMILLNIQFEEKRIRAVSVPRDTFVMVDYGDGLRGDKIAHVYRRGEVGWKSSKAAVERLTRMKIDHYATVDYGLFREFVDAIGGVHIDIEKRMFYEDRAGGLYIDFQPGEIVLDGQKALEYVRFRKDGKGDIGRIERQQKFIRAVVAQLLGMEAWRGLFRTEKLQRILSHLQTDFEVSQIPPLAYQFRDVAAPTAFEAQVLPGRHALRETKWSAGRPLSYFFVDRAHLDQILDTWFLSQARPAPTEAEAAMSAFDAVAEAGVVASATDPEEEGAEEETPGASAEDEVQVEVLPPAASLGAGAGGE
jgi:LCP family protein required for cell wall assembly